MRTLACQKLLKRLIKKSKMLDREKFLGEKLAQLLVYDVIFGQGVRGKFKGTMKRNYTSLTEAVEYYMKKKGCESREALQKLYEDESKDSQMIKPKYIYLNTLVEDKKHLLDKLKADKFLRVKNSSDLRDMIKSLKNNQFVKDDLVQNLLIFSPDSLLNKTHYLFNEGYLMQIDKVFKNFH